MTKKESGFNKKRLVSDTWMPSKNLATGSCSRLCQQKCNRPWGWCNARQAKRSSTVFHEGASSGCRLSQLLDSFIADLKQVYKNGSRRVPWSFWVGRVDSGQERRFTLLCLINLQKKTTFGSFCSFSILTYINFSVNSLPVLLPFTHHTKQPFLGLQKSPLDQLRKQEGY